MSHSAAYRPLPNRSTTMRLIKGVGNVEILLWAVGTIVLCHLVALPMTHFFSLDTTWRAPKGANYSDYEKELADHNVELKSALDRLHNRMANDNFSVTVADLPHFTPEVYCPYLVTLGDRKFCAPWLVQKGVVRNRMDVGKLKDEKKHVETPKKEGNALEGSSGPCSFHSMHAAGGVHSHSDTVAKDRLPKCTHTHNEQVALTPQPIDMTYVSAGLSEDVSLATIESNGVCQLVIDFPIDGTAIKRLRELGELGYRVMNYEIAYDSTIRASPYVARFSLIASTCTDHFGAKYIKKYLV